VLGGEVIHGINDLARFLGGRGEIQDESEIVTADSFARHQSFFQDQQNVLAYETQRLQEYTILTERRARDVYDTIKRSNKSSSPGDQVPYRDARPLDRQRGVIGGLELPVITAGVSLAQFLGAFFTQPTSDLQHNLTNLATFRIILESHSLNTAFARFHLTTPGMLRELRTKEESDAAKVQIDTLQRQLGVILSLDRTDFESLRDLGFGADGAAAPVEAAAAPTTPPATEEAPAATSSNGDGAASTQ
jgi:hypothetical protein